MAKVINSYQLGMWKSDVENTEQKKVNSNHKEIENQKIVIY